jgi:hypothetical protein
MADKKLATVAEFAAWAGVSTQWDAGRRYGLTRWNLWEPSPNPEEPNVQKIRWYLRGKTSSYRYQDTVIPAELGELFAASWKQNQYNEYVGVRTIAGLLKLIDAAKDTELGKLVKAAVAVAKENEAIARRNNVRRSVAAKIEELHKLVGEHGNFIGLDVDVFRVSGENWTKLCAALTNEPLKELPEVSV